MAHQNEHDSGANDGVEGAVATENALRVERPRLFRVLVHNDDYTTMEFVVMVLVTVFHLSEQSAVKIMLTIHEKGVGVAGVFSYEVAEARISKVARLARENDFPLRCSMEPD